MGNRPLMNVRDEGAKSPGGLSWGGQAADVGPFFKDIRHDMALFDNKPLPDIREALADPSTPIFYLFLAARALNELDKPSRNSFLNALLHAPGIIVKRCNSIATDSGFKNSGTMPHSSEVLLRKCPFMKYVNVEEVLKKNPTLVEESAREGFITDQVWYDTGLVDIFEAARQDYMEKDVREPVIERPPPEGWKKPPSREHRTLIQRDFEHLSNPKRVAERRKYYSNLKHEEEEKAKQETHEKAAGILQSGNRTTKTCSNFECSAVILCHGLPQNWIGCEKCYKAFCCEKCAKDESLEKFQASILKHIQACVQVKKEKAPTKKSNKK